MAIASAGARARARITTYMHMFLNRHISRRVASTRRITRWMHSTKLNLRSSTSDRRRSHVQPRYRQRYLLPRFRARHFKLIPTKIRGHEFLTGYPPLYIRPTPSS